MFCLSRSYLAYIYKFEVFRQKKQWKLKKENFDEKKTFSARNFLFRLIFFLNGNAALFVEVFTEKPFDFARCLEKRVLKRSANKKLFRNILKINFYMKRNGKQFFFYVIVDIFIKTSFSFSIFLINPL